MDRIKGISVLQKRVARRSPCLHKLEPCAYDRVVSVNVTSVLAECVTVSISGCGLLESCRRATCL